MQRLQYQCTFEIQLSSAVKDHVFVLRALPQSFPGQEILISHFAIFPQAAWVNQKDSFGNFLQYGRLDEEHDTFSYVSEGTAEIDFSKKAPEEVLPIYRFPSALTQIDESEVKKVRTLLEKGLSEKAFSDYLCHMVHDSLDYAPGETSIKTTAMDALKKGRGVCQDYAHIFIMYARACGRAARYVNGYCSGEGASHAWCEILEDGLWQGIDPTRRQRISEDYIRFNVGRDYLDCPLEQGVFTGLASQVQKGTSSIVTLSPQ